MTKPPTSPPPVPTSGGPKTLLEETSDHIQARLQASGVPEVPHPPRMPGELTATFIPRRRQPSEPGDNTTQLNPVVRDLLGFLLSNDYVNPPHDKWMEMWRMIPEDENGHKAGGPVPLEAWSVWPNRERHACLVRHIECADARGVIDKIDNYLRHSVEPDEWIIGLLTT